MRILGDYHTHTTYTHGTSTVEENVRQAEKLGLKEIAITEHCYKGYNHIKAGDLEKIKNDIDSIKDKYNVKILMGIEANLMSRNGDIDITDKELAKLDIVVLGYHKASKLKFSEFLKFGLPNHLLKKPTKKQIERNTNAYLNAINKHRINILAHLGYGGCAVDCVKIAKECVKKNIFIELNGKRINFTKQDIDGMIATGVKFIIDSDAHSVNAVGKNHRAFNLIEKYNIPREQIANLDKLPNFNN
ncbi:MAG: PHP domain-containing protein [Christensenellales bacterium]